MEFSFLEFDSSTYEDLGCHKSYMLLEHDHAHVDHASSALGRLAVAIHVPIFRVQTYMQYMVGHATATAVHGYLG